MSEFEQRVEKHYASGGIVPSILKALEDGGNDLHSLKPVDLAPVDEFHTRGRESTLELAALAQFSTGMTVLDIGCGLGGSVRHIASQHDCTVTGIDLTEEYIETARALTDMVGLSDRVSFYTGSASDLPFDDAAFDVVWTEHAQMNIADKTGFYGEMARVLKPAGRLVFHDIFLGPAANPQYPTPWAEQESLSALATPDVIKTAIKDAHLKLIDWQDMSQQSLEWFDNALKKMQTSGPQPLGLHLLMGNTAKAKFNNIVHNLNGEHIVIVQGVATRL